MKRLLTLLLAVICLVGCTQENHHVSKETLVNELFEQCKHGYKSESDFRELYSKNTNDKEIKNIYANLKKKDYSSIKDIKNIKIKEVGKNKNDEYLLLSYDILLQTKDDVLSIPQIDIVFVTNENGYYYLNTIDQDRYLGIVKQLETKEFIQKILDEQMRILKENQDFMNQLNKEVQQRQQQRFIEEQNKFTQDSANQAMQDAQNAANQSMNQGMPFQ